jgi:hypothetical protein
MAASPFSNSVVALKASPRTVTKSARQADPGSRFGIALVKAVSHFVTMAFIASSSACLPMSSERPRFVKPKKSKRWSKVL